MIRAGPHPDLSPRAATLLGRVHAGLTAVVWSNLAALYAFAVTAALLTGKWPSYGHPDPKDLGLAAVRILVFLSFYGVAGGFVLWLVLLPFFTFALGIRHAGRMVLLSVLGLTLTVVNFVSDPLGVVNWFFD